MVERNCVVIVGAGPVGLVSAVCLARAGIPSVLLEASPETPRDLRASTVHPPTLDMLDEIGVAEDYIKLGITTDSWQVIHLGTRERVLFDLASIKDHTRHPYRLQCEQYNLAPILFEHARASGLVEIHLGAEVTEVSPGRRQGHGARDRGRRAAHVRRPLPDRRRRRAQRRAPLPRPCRSKASPTSIRPR